jgi:hypothetical protein
LRADDNLTKKKNHERKRENKINKSSGQSQTRRHPTEFCSVNTQENRKEPTVVMVVVVEVNIVGVVIVSCSNQKVDFISFTLFFVASMAARK